MSLEEISNGNLNKVFKLNFENKNYIIRISEFNNNFETKVLKALEKYDMNTPKIKAGFIFENKFVMICDYIKGIHPDIYDELFYKNLSDKMKKLHNIKLSLDIENVNFESLEKLKEYYEASIVSKYLKHNLNIVERVFKEVSSNLELNKLPKCLIHSDLKRENIIVDNNEVYLIDFGNCYIGNRLIDIIRVLMWFFIKNDNYDICKMKIVVKNYFDVNNKMTTIEKNNLELLFKFCLLYNLLKDIYLFEKELLTNEYIETSSLKWLEPLKDEKKLETVLGVLRNA